MFGIPFWNGISLLLYPLWCALLCIPCKQWAFIFVSKWKNRASRTSSWNTALPSSSFSKKLIVSSRVLIFFIFWRKCGQEFIRNSVVDAAADNLFQNRPPGSSKAIHLEHITQGWCTQWGNILRLAFYIFRQGFSVHLLQIWLRETAKLNDNAGDEVCLDRWRWPTHSSTPKGHL